MSTATAWDVIYAANDKHFSQNGDCDGLWVTDTTYVNSIDMRIDMDYLQAYLIEVCDVDRDATEHFIDGEMQPSQTGETWVSYLAVFQCHAGLGEVDVSWYDGDDLGLLSKHRRPQPARIRFFDQRSDYAVNVRHWFIDWAEACAKEYAERLRSR